jgi:hypothetical protein
MDIIVFILLLSSFVSFVIAAAKAPTFTFWIGVGLAAYILSLLVNTGFHIVHLG